MLEELHSNLREECQRLQQPLADNNDDEAIGQFMHRLEGLACTIDAPGLLRACEGVRQAASQGVDLDPAQAQLVAVLLGLLDDIRHRHPDRPPRG